MRKTFDKVAPNAKVMLHIFEHTIKPIILYGSEIWGFFSPIKFSNNIDKYIRKEIDSLIVEKLHTKCCKYILGVRTKSSNDASRGELGSLPILYCVILNLIKYWCHINKTDPKCRTTSLLYNAFIMSKNMDNEKKESWVGCIREIFKYLKLDFLFQNSDKFKTNYIINKVKLTLRSKFVFIWKENLHNDNKRNSNCGNKLRTYRTFKRDFTFEPYLLIGKREEKQMLTKFRISDHSLEIERGRYIGLDVKDRICKNCNYEIEDELHFLLKCHMYTNERDNHLSNIMKINKNFHKLSYEDKFIWLLSSEDKDIIKIIYMMLKVFYTKRNNTIDKNQG